MEKAVKRENEGEEEKKTEPAEKIVCAKELGSDEEERAKYWTNK